MKRFVLLSSTEWFSARSTVSSAFDRALRRAFPVWLAPLQVQIIPVSHVHLDYCRKVQAELKQAGIRAGIDERNEKLGYKIRESQVQKIPYVLVLGDHEEQEDAVNVRRFDISRMNTFLFRHSKISL